MNLEFEYAFLTVTADGQPQGQQHGLGQCWVEDLGAGITLELVSIPGGTFLMGAPKTEEGWHPSQSPQHEVAIAPFWIGKYPVTQAQWRAVAALPKVKQPLEPKPGCFDGGSRPVEQVSWLDAVEFCDRLSRFVETRLSAKTGQQYSLPTEAEWEYACRANGIDAPEDLEAHPDAKSQTPFCFGETITTDLANYSGIDWEFEGRICSKGAYGKGPTGGDRRETTEVGHFQVANRWGLYDMHGNVREWCQDCWHPSYTDAPIDGSAWIAGGDCNQRLLRGGSWNSGPRSCRSAARGKMEPDASLYDVGFRVVLKYFRNH